MKKILLITALTIAFFSCEKEKYCKCITTFYHDYATYQPVIEYKTIKDGECSQFNKTNRINDHFYSVTIGYEMFAD